MNPTRLQIAGWGAFLLIAGLISLGLIKPWGIGLDFANFYDAGQKARAGEFAALYDPFALISGQEPLGHMTFFSAPVTSLFYAPLASMTPRTALFVFKFTGTIALLAGLVMLYRHAGAMVGADGPARTAYFALFLIAAFFFQPFWTIYRVGGQTTPFVFLLLVVGHIAYLRGSFVLTALIFSLIVVIKPVFGPAAFLLFVLSSGGFRVTALMAAATVGGLSVLYFGWELHREFLARILDENRFLQSPWQNSSPFSWVEPFFVDPDAYRSTSELPGALRLGGRLARLGVAGAIVWALRRQLAVVVAPAARRHLIYSAALLLVIIISPVIWAHYLAVIFIPLAFIIARRNLLPRGAVGIFALATGLCLFQNLILIQRLEGIFGFDTTPEIVAIGLLKSLPALLFVIGALMYHRPLAESLRGATVDQGS